MTGFEDFKAEQEAEGKEPNMRQYFEQKIYVQKEIAKVIDSISDEEEVKEEPESEPDVSMDDPNAIEFFDTQGNKVSMKEDELFYIQGLMGKVDWEAFATKNQERLDKIKKVDAKVKEVKKLQEDKENGKPAEEETEIKVNIEKVKGDGLI